MLTNEETLLLVEQAKNGDNSAKERLITLNSPLIKSVIKRYLNKGVEYDDLFQLGAMGFVKALNNYDAAYNVKFTTYAVPMIAGEIKRFLRDDGSVKVSRTIKRLSIEIKNFVQEYENLYNANPRLEVIAKALNYDIDDIILAMEANTNPLSLDDKVGNDADDCSIQDKLADGFSADSMINRITLRDMIKNLSAREKQVIIMRYYLDRTQSEIAKELGVSQVQVSRIESKVLNDLKSQMNDY